MSRSMEQTVAGHYTHGDLERALLEALRRAGKDPEHLSLDDLAPADEFHIGGRAVTIEFAQQLDLKPGQRLLDVGSGLGGPARYVAHAHGCLVTGIDLTDEYVRTARALSARVGLADKVTFVQGTALDMPFPTGSFDGAYMLHVGMNIEDKAALFGQVRRVLKPGGFFGIYDIMRTSAGDIAYPVPWARTADSSFVAESGTYRRLLSQTGFAVGGERSRRDFAIEFFRRIRARTAESGPPPVGLHIAMGDDFADKTANMIANLERGVLSPIEMISRLAA